MHGRVQIHFYFLKITHIYQIHSEFKKNIFLVQLNSQKVESFDWRGLINGKSQIMQINEKHSIRDRQTSSCNKQNHIKSDKKMLVLILSEI